MSYPKDRSSLDGATSEGTLHHKPTSKLVLFFLLAFVVLGVCAYQYRVALTAELDSLRLLPREETFTELYVNDFATLAKNLPTSIAPKKSILFSFSVHNLEGRHMSYPYAVYIVDQATGTTTIDQNVLEMKDGVTKSLTEKYTFHATSTGATVYVHLLKPDQSIHFFVPARI